MSDKTSVPEYPLGSNKGWKKLGGTDYESRVYVNGIRRLVRGNILTGFFTVYDTSDPASDILGTFDGTKFNLFDGQEPLDFESTNMVEKTIPLRLYAINEKVAEITKSAGGNIVEGESISESEQLDFRSTGAYLRISNTIEPNPTSDISNLTESGNINPVNSNRLEIPSGGLTYPITEKNHTQDYIQFGIGEYKPKDLKLNPGELGTIAGSGASELDTPNILTNPIGFINLPIQPSIVDSNSVSWNEDSLNPLQVAGLQIGKTLVNEGSGGIDSIIKGILGQEEKNVDDNLIRAGKLLIAQESVGARNLLSRFGGAVINPNLELLFTGPQLRPFNFNFKLSPRSGPEGQVVKRIIRTFKQSMAPKVTKNKLFLAAPYIFSIRYMQAKGDGDFDHPSLNRIKLCALKSCVVDYTPENSYMTFKDSSNTMVSYNMSLQFQELEPVTDEDYAMSDNPNSNIGVEIGY